MSRKALLGFTPSLVEAISFLRRLLFSPPLGVSNHTIFLPIQLPSRTHQNPSMAPLEPPTIFLPYSTTGHHHNPLSTCYQRRAPSLRQGDSSQDLQQPVCFLCGHTSVPALGPWGFSSLTRDLLSTTYHRLVISPHRRASRRATAVEQKEV